MNSSVMNSDVRLGNLHIRLEGEFSTATAKEVTRHISNEWDGSGNIFIHTKNVTAVQPASQQVFQAMVGLLDLSRERIYFVGELGKELCHEHGRVIVPPDKKHHHHGGCGRCKNCKCGKKKETVN